MIYMQSTLEVDPRERNAFDAIMAEIVSYMEENHGWQLLHAFVQFTGRLYTYVDLWQMTDAIQYQAGLAALRQCPAFPRIQAVLHNAVRQETVVLGMPAAYGTTR